MPCRSRLFALVALLALSPPPMSIVRAADRPMAGMEMKSGSAQDPEMRDMMAAPLPFGIMIGRSERWMVGYQFSYERQDGMLVGSDHVGAASVLEDFATSPTDMTMTMHMAMVMYAPTARFTVMAMIPYLAMSMGEVHDDGTHTTESSGGIGDVELRGLYTLSATKDLRRRFLLNFGVALPTGSIDQRDAEGARTEYPMQTGSGTYSILPGFTYLGRALPWSWGAGLDATVRLGWNDHDYRLGNRYLPSAWLTRQVASWLCLSGSLRGEYRGNIHGADPALDPTDEPPKDPDLQGGTRIDVLLGLTINPAGKFFEGQQFFLEGGVPVVQSLDGPQLAQSYTAQFAWQWEF